jgi:predicted esterase YcpF (UPF0227 family)
MNQILYIHGFKSTGNALKAQILKKKFPLVFSPTLPLSPFKALDFLIFEIEKNTYDLIIGSSLGGFYALSLHKLLGSKILLINPSLEPWKSLDKQVGTHQQFETQQTFEWKHEYNQQLFEINNDLSENTINQSNIYFFLSTDDELLNHSQIPVLFPQSQIWHFDNAKHQFTAFTRTIPLINTILNSTQG